MPRPATKKTLLGLTLIAATGLGAFFVFGALRSDAAAQMGDMPAMPVPVIVVEERPVQVWKEFSARLNAVDIVEIRPQVSGRITEVHFEDGQNVAEGDLLYTIDPRPFEAAVEMARADLSAANTAASLAKKDKERAEELVKTGALSRQVYDQRTSELSSAYSAIAAARARLQSAEVDLDNALIKAPVAGRISRSEITLGNLVSAAAAPLLTTIVADSRIYADFEIDEQTYLGHIRDRAKRAASDEDYEIPVKMAVTGDENWYEGVVHSFDNRISSSSGTIRARAIFDNEDGALLSGMFARAQIGSNGDEPRIVIPEKAIGTDQIRKFVYVVGEDNTATYRRVTPGDSVEDMRIITEGLEVGDRVIIDNLMKLRPGAPVQPMSPEELAGMKAQMAASAAGATDAQEAAPVAAETPVPETSAPEMPASSQDAPPQPVAPATPATPATPEEPATDMSEQDPPEAIPFEEPALEENMREPQSEVPPADASERDDTFDESAFDEGAVRAPQAPQSETARLLTSLNLRLQTQE